MAAVPASIQNLFHSAGWFPGRRSDFVPDPALNSHAAAVLSEFGGLRVGACGAGRDCAASDVQFYVTPDSHASIVTEPWRNAIGELTAIADAHHEHIVVFVSSTGAYYFFTDPDGRLYMGGHSFEEAMERLLLGIDYGQPIGRA
jgi:hypothetical protein